MPKPEGLPVAADSIIETIRGQRLWAALGAIGLAILLIVGIGHASIGTAAPVTAASSSGNLTGLAKLIFTTYVYPFEITSALLITAALGAIVLAHREWSAPKPTQPQTESPSSESAQGQKSGVPGSKPGQTGQSQAAGAKSGKSGPGTKLMS